MWRSWPSEVVDANCRSIGKPFFSAVGYPVTRMVLTDRRMASWNALYSLSRFASNATPFLYHIIGLPSSGKTITTMYFMQESLQDWFVVWLTLGVEYTHICVQSHERRHSAKVGSNENIPDILQSILSGGCDGLNKRMIILDGWDNAAGIGKEIGCFLEDWVSDRHRVILIYNSGQTTKLNPHECRRFANATVHDSFVPNECSPGLKLLNHGIETGEKCLPFGSGHLAQNKSFYSGGNEDFFSRESVNGIIKKIRSSLSRFTLWDKQKFENTLLSENSIECNWSSDNRYLFYGSRDTSMRSLRPMLVSQFAALEFARVHGSKGVEEMYMCMRKLGAISMNGWWQEMWVLGSLVHDDVHVEYCFHDTNETVKVVWKKTEVEYFDPENPPAYFGGKWLTPAIRMPGIYAFVSESNNILRFYYFGHCSAGPVFSLLSKLGHLRGKPFDFVYIVFITGRRVFGTETFCQSRAPAEFIKDRISSFENYGGNSDFGLTFHNVAVATVETQFRPIDRNDGLGSTDKKKEH